MFHRVFLTKPKTKGKVRWFNKEKGYGVIVSSDTNEDLVVYQNRIMDHNTKKHCRYLLPNEDVEFRTSNYNGRLIAVDVTGPGGAHLDCNVKTLKQNVKRGVITDSLSTAMTHLDMRQILSNFLTVEEFDNYYNNLGDNAAHIAVRKNLIGVLKAFAKRSDWIKLYNGQNYDMMTPLHLAVKCGFIECVEILMQHFGQNASKIRNREGDVPLHTAINFQKNEVAELLLSYSAVDPTVTNADGNNSLHLAIAKGELRIIEIILHLKPELVNVYNKNGFSPLHLAIFNVNEKVADYLISEVLCNKNARVVKRRSYRSFTPLHLAVVKMQPMIIESLVEHGIDLNLTEDMNGCTALHLAIENLISCGGCGITADRLFTLQEIEPNQFKMDELLKRAGECLPLAICCYLLGKGAKINFKNQFGLSPLQLLPEQMKKFTVVLKSMTFIHESVKQFSKSQQIVPVSFLSKSPNHVEDDNCNLCNDTPSKVRFEPCNHVLYCENCIQIVADRIQKCIRCNREILFKVGPKGEVGSSNAQVQKVDTAVANGETKACSVCYETPKNWMVPKCGHPVCEKCSHLVKECHKCGQRFLGLRPT